MGDELRFTEEEMEERVQAEVDRILVEDAEAEQAEQERKQTESEEMKEKAIALAKKVELVTAGIPCDEVGRYARYLDDTIDRDVLKQQAQEIADDANYKRKSKPYGDPGKPSNGGKWSPFSK
ncbi:hypothetical protein [Halobacillus seohaensis]|uniref:Uncharacterized protein n=1 Tax=Halobacillus seohaensis TaxID=447421 RepID=A0ABW2EMQ9_9BACI